MICDVILLATALNMYSIICCCNLWYFPINKTIIKMIPLITTVNDKK